MYGFLNDTVVYIVIYVHDIVLFLFIKINLYDRHQLLPQISQLLSGVEGIPDIWRQTGRPCIPRLVCSLKQVSQNCSVFFLHVHVNNQSTPFGLIWIRNSDPRSLKSWYNNGADESMTRVDLSVLWCTMISVMSDLTCTV